MPRSIRPGRAAPTLLPMLGCLLPAAPFLHAEMVLDRSVLAFDGDRIRFRNLGNTNVLLHKVNQCPEGIDPGSEDCVETATTRRLYSGKEWELDPPLAAPMEFTTTVGRRNVRRRFD